jgi:hypothetical protein
MHASVEGRVKPKKAQLGTLIQAYGASKVFGMAMLLTMALAVGVAAALEAVR